MFLVTQLRLGEGTLCNAKLHQSWEDIVQTSRLADRGRGCGCWRGYVRRHEPHAWDKTGLRDDAETAPDESILRKWEVGSFEDIASAKMGHMTVNSLEDIMGEFPKAFDIVKPLCLQLRRLLFPLDKDERMMIGTPAGDPEQLYGAIRSTFDEAVSQI